MFVFYYIFPTKVTNPNLDKTELLQTVSLDEVKGDKGSHSCSSPEFHSGFTPLHSEDESNTNDTIPTLKDDNQEESSCVYEESQRTGGYDDFFDM